MIPKNESVNQKHHFCIHTNHVYDIALNDKILKRTVFRPGVCNGAKLISKIHEEMDAAGLDYHFTDDSMDHGETNPFTGFNLSMTMVSNLKKQVKKWRRKCKMIQNLSMIA